MPGPARGQPLRSRSDRNQGRAERQLGATTYHTRQLCLVLPPSVNAYRRFDRHHETPNQTKVSPTDRGSMIRISIGNERSFQIEVHSIAPHACRTTSLTRRECASRASSCTRSWVTA